VVRLLETHLFQRRKTIYRKLSSDILNERYLRISVGNNCFFASSVTLVKFYPLIITLDII